jgi:hypothetical protein
MSDDFRAVGTGAEFMIEIGKFLATENKKLNL